MTQNLIAAYWGGNFQGIGNLGVFSTSDVNPAANLFNNVMRTLIGLLTVIAGLWFIFQFITGAISWISAGGDKGKIQAAQSKITTAILGLAVVVIAVFLIEIISRIFGLRILSPKSILLLLTP